jgi:hypothetical protein
MEVMVGANADLVEPSRRFLEGFNIIALDDAIATARRRCGERTASGCPAR